MDSTTALYAFPEIKALVSAYVTQKNLVNPREQQYVNLDDVLVSVLQSGGRVSRAEAPPEFMKREELTRKLADKMQAWHEIQPEDKDAIVRCATPPHLFLFSLNTRSQERPAEANLGSDKDTAGSQGVYAHHKL
jgi:hypothetical protein